MRDPIAKVRIRSEAQISCAGAGSFCLGLKLGPCLMQIYFLGAELQGGAGAAI